MHHPDYIQTIRNLSVSNDTTNTTPLTSDCCYSSEPWHYSTNVTPMKQIEGRLFLKSLKKIVPAKLIFRFHIVHGYF